MLKLKIFLVLFSIILTQQVSAQQWDRISPIPYALYSYENKTANFGLPDFRSVTGLFFPTHHYPQPTNFTCGAATLDSLLFWETAITSNGNGLILSPHQIYNIANTTGGPTSGLTTNELKAGIPAIFKSRWKGVWIIDSVYNSPAYSDNSIVKNNAIPPNAYVSLEELKRYWKPTGSALPWLRKHFFVNDSTEHEHSASSRLW